MSYTSQTWTDGTSGATPVSATRLGHMESGIAEQSGRLDVVTGVEVIAASGTSKTLDCSISSAKKVTLTGNCTFTFTGATSGTVASLELVLVQDGTGSRTVTWPSSVKWSGGAPTLTTTASAVDRVVCTSYDGGTTWYGDLIGKAYA